MERNYDEIIADLLRQVDKHSEELSKHSRELTIVSKESRRAHRELLQQLAALKKDHQQFQTDQQKIHSHHLELIIHSATILDRIIKKNDLRL